MKSIFRKFRQFFSFWLNIRQFQAFLCIFLLYKMHILLYNNIDEYSTLTYQGVEKMENYGATLKKLIKFTNVTIHCCRRRRIRCFIYKQMVQSIQAAGSKSCRFNQQKSFTNFRIGNNITGRAGKLLQWIQRNSYGGTAFGIPPHIVKGYI